MMRLNKDHTNRADELLMQLIVDGDEHAFAQLYDRYKKAMLNYFYKMLWQDREKAEDFMQELFLKIINKPHLYDTSRSFKTWLYSVANNMCKNEYRKQEVRKNTSIGLDSSWHVSDKGQDAVGIVDDTIFGHRLEQELATLGEKQKMTFVMRFQEEMSIKEIADACECSEGTVKSRIFYTLKKLAIKLKEFNPTNKLDYEKRIIGNG